jgi:3-phosphoshikimate 1-carboxyvinyltransferase
MANKRFKTIKGKYFPPGDKSISHRILILTGQAIGQSKITNLLEGEDVINTLKVMRQLGVKITKKMQRYLVYGVPPGGLFEPKNNLDFGNSGTGIRLLSGLIASNDIKATLVGDKSLSGRPMKRVTSHLERIGAVVKLKKNLYPPIKIYGTGQSIPLNYEIKIPSAQIKSAILLSALNTNGLIKLKEFNSTRDHTENMLKAMGYNIKVKEKQKYRFIEMKNDKDLSPINYNVPGDPSSAAFFITAACMIPGSRLEVKNILFNKTRIGFIKTLKKMGGNIKIVNIKKVNFETIADIIVKQTKYLKATKLRESDIPMQVDEIPILSIAASYAKGTTIFKGLKELTVKESNRLLLVQQNLIKMGVNAEIRNDYDLYIHGGHDLKKGGASIVHHHDHRIVMSFYIANLICLKNNKIDDKSSVKTSYPKFFKDFKRLLN